MSSALLSNFFDFLCNYYVCADDYEDEQNVKSGHHVHSTSMYSLLDSFRQVDKILPLPDCKSLSPVSKFLRYVTDYDYPIPPTLESTAASVVVGTWKGGRTGVFVGTRPGKGYSGTATGTKGKADDVGKYDGYRPLVVDIVRFFRTGKSSIPDRETIEIYAFMEAADESKRQKGKPVSI